MKVRGIFIALTLAVSTLFAQEYLKEEDRAALIERNKLAYFAIQAENSLQSFNIQSDLDQLNGLQYLKHGGAIGATFGNRVFRVPVKYGIFFNDIKGLRSVENRELSVGGELSLNQFSKTRWFVWDVYLIGGYVSTNVSYRGGYLEPIAVSDMQQPLLGWSKQNAVYYGGGASIRLNTCEDSFITLYMEYSVRRHLFDGESTMAFSQTHLQDITNASLGVKIGIL